MVESSPTGTMRVCKAHTLLLSLYFLSFNCEHSFGHNTNLLHTRNNFNSSSLNISIIILFLVKQFLIRQKYISPQHSTTFTRIETAKKIEWGLTFIPAGIATLLPIHYDENNT
jgi:hypothetical protein